MTENIKLNPKQAGFVEYYETSGSSTYHNAMGSAIKAGYAYNTAKQACKILVENPRIKQAISVIQAQNSIKVEHNREIAIDLLRTNLQALSAKIKEGNISAVQAATGVIRELDAITGLHDQQSINVVINVEHKTAAQEKELLEARLARLDRLEDIPDCIDR